jgi:isocitrate dehydrogenase (NAD+)
MLRHLGQDEVVARLRGALRTVIVERRIMTRDLGGTATTSGFADAVIEELGRAGGGGA